MKKDTFEKFVVSLVGCLMLLFVGILPNAYAIPVSLSGDSLQTFFNTESWGLNATTDQMAMPSAWTLTTGSQGSDITLYKDSSNIAFGVYSMYNELAEVFDGNDTPVAAAILSFTGSNALTVQWLDNSNLSLGSSTYQFTGSSFGFYIATGTYGNYTSIYYSDPTKNDINNNNITGEDADVALLAYNIAPGAYVFAGDIDNDRDFSDIVTHAESIAPVPEPATIILFGTGLIGFAGTMRRKMKKK